MFKDFFNKKSFKTTLLMRGSTDGFTKEVFADKVEGKGSTIFVVKTTTGRYLEALLRSHGPQ